AVVERFDRIGDRLVPHLPPSALAGVRRRAEVELPIRANDPFAVTDETSGLSMEVRLDGAHDAPVEIAGGYAVYRGAYGAGSDLVHRVTAEGTEDYIILARGPDEARVDYDIVLSDDVAGLRLVARTLELLDA